MTTTMIAPPVNRAAVLDEAVDVLIADTFTVCGRGEPVYVRIENRPDMLVVDVTTRGGEAQRHGARVMLPFVKHGYQEEPPLVAARREIESIGGRLRTINDIGRAITFRVELPHEAALTRY